MRLKKVQKSNDDWQKCCRYCHYYENGKCLNSHMTTEEDLAVYSVAEEGYLDETLEETLGSVRLEEFRELEYLLRGYKLSEKRIKEFNDLFGKCWEEFRQNTLKTELEENVAKCYQNHLESNNESVVEILDPEDYCCKEWC